MRRLLPILSVLGLALSGCGGDAPGDAASPPAASPTADDASPSPTPAASDDATPDAPSPDTDDEPPAEGDCSAFGVTAQGMFDGLPTATRDTAAFLLDAAVRCDEQLVYTAATESGTRLTFGALAPDDLFQLPEDPTRDPAPWETLALLLGATTPVADEDGSVWSWPAVFAGEGTDEQWQELADTGLYDAATLEAMRASDDGYLGWRVGIDADGDWLFMVEGD